MRFLALDTATEACSLALWQDGAVLQRYEVVGRGHTERLLPLFQELMAEAGIVPAQLDGFACGVGPGSFAGVRIGVGLIKGLALALDRPAAPISSLAMLAQAAADAGAGRVLACIDARMSEVYFAPYERGADGLVRPLAHELVTPPDQVRAPAGRWQGVGTGWGTYESVLRSALAGAELEAIDGQALPNAAAALRLALPLLQSGAAPSGDDLAPVYLRDRVALTLVEQVAARAAKAAAAAAN